MKQGSKTHGVRTARCYRASYFSNGSILSGDNKGGVAVFANDLKLAKTWDDIAERARHERNPQKLTELAQKLLDALDEQAHQCQAKQKPARNGSLRRRDAA
jgi:hypothetical protein